MQEIVTKAIVLDRNGRGEIDAQVDLYTEKLGRVRAKAKSVSLMSSKLSSHLQALNLVEIRLVQKKGFQIVDALLVKNFKKDLLDNKKINFLKEMVSVLDLIIRTTNEQEPDEDLWILLERGNIFGKKVLQVLGFDPTHARCSNCQKEKPSHFVIRDMQYVCKNCIRSHKSHYFTV